MKPIRSSISLLCRASLLTALLCVLAVITIPIGTVPVTMGVLGVFLCGMLLPPRYALLSVLAYLALGIVGLPVFSSMQGGIGVLFGPTGGFLAAYPLMALLPSFARTSTRFPARGIAGTVLSAAACLLGLAVCYLLGCTWYVFSTGSTWLASTAVCVLPFLPFDLLKIAAAVFAGRLFSAKFS